jgi:hypothetical protein
MIKRFKLWQWKRSMEKHKGFSTETNDFIKRIVAHINEQQFIDSDIKEQIGFIEIAYRAIQALEVIVQMNKTFNQFFDMIQANRTSTKE